MIRKVSKAMGVQKKTASEKEALLIKKIKKDIERGRRLV